MRAIVYDLEIRKCVPKRNVENSPNLEYCEGWRDHAAMGVASLVAFDMLAQQYRIFMQDNLPDFEDLVSEADLLVGFNNIHFDNSVLGHNGFSKDALDAKSYDILVELWRALGLGPTYRYPSHAGYTLQAVALANLGTGKTGNGAFAPELFQLGQFGTLLDYNLRDVYLTAQLFERIDQRRPFWNPKPKSKDNRRLTLRHPRLLDLEDDQTDAATTDIE